MKWKIVGNSLSGDFIYGRIDDDGLIRLTGSSDYPELQAWLAEGNTPDPPDPQPEPVNEPTMQQEIDALKLVVGMLMEEDDDV